MIVVKAEALGFEFAPVVGQAFVPRSPRRHLNLRASFTKKQNSETGSWQARAVQVDIRRLTPRFPLLAPSCIFYGVVHETVWTTGTYSCLGRQVESFESLW